MNHWISGNALNSTEIAVLQKDIHGFIYCLIVSALHNHWLFTEPVIMSSGAKTLRHLQ